VTRRHDPFRRRVSLALPAALALAGGGCVSLGRDAPVPVWYLLEDPGASAVNSAGAARIPLSLLVGPVLATSFDESVMLSYGRAAGTRAHYQFAGWTEPPSRRIAVLVERRLAARGRFASVARSTAGVRGDLLLNLSLEHFYHDVSASPGQARIALAAELVDWRKRALLGRRVSERRSPVLREDASAAVLAIGDALSGVLDELCPWVEETASRAVAAG